MEFYNNEPQLRLIKTMKTKAKPDNALAEKVFNYGMETAWMGIDSNKVEYKVSHDHDGKVSYFMIRDREPTCRTIAMLMSIAADVYKGQSGRFKVPRLVGMLWDECKNILMPILLGAAQYQPDFKIVISGFGAVGSVLAFLLAEDYHYRTSLKVGELVAFGCPRFVKGDVCDLTKGIEHIELYRCMADYMARLNPLLKCPAKQNGLRCGKRSRSKSQNGLKGWIMELAKPFVKVSKLLKYDFDSIYCEPHF